MGERIDSCPFSTTTTSTTSTTTTTTSAPCGQFELQYSSFSGTGQRFQMPLNGAFYQAFRNETIYLAFSQECFCRVVGADTPSSRATGAWVWTASLRYYCYRYTGDTALTSPTSTTSESYQRLD